MRRGLSGSRGNLNPHHNNETKCNRQKLYIEFDNECASDYKDVKKVYKNLIKDNKDCLYEDKHKHKNNIYYINSTSSYHAYVYLKNEGCEDNLDVDYDEYCIQEFDYETVLEVTSSAASCSSQSSFLGTTYLWHTDYFDGSIDNSYSYVTMLICIF